MGGVGCALGKDPLDLGQLAHEVRFCVEPACGVAQEKLHVPAVSGLIGVVADGCRITVVLAFDDVTANPLRPDVELFNGGRTEGVCGGQENAVAALF